MILFFLFSNTCPTCAVAKSELAAVQAHRFDFTPILRAIDYSGDGRDNILGWTPKATPAYALVYDNERINEHQGLLKRDQLNKFLNEGASVVAAMKAESIGGGTPKRKSAAKPKAGGARHGSR